ncbi:OmpA family protein [Sphingobium sp. CR28]|uniref:OmpA family protein n=1 Tax=Sphingobium sp. CR28 TaxID=3400272 RepID=UPI003FED5A07
MVASKPEAPAIEPVHVVILFGAAGLKLDDAGRNAVDALLEAPVMKTGGPIVLRGHSDSRGSDGDNLVASRIRAERVRDYLIERGVEKQRITVIALGETRPAVPNAHEDGSDDPEGRAKNRRVEVDIDIPKAPGAVPVSLPKPASAPAS